MPNRAREVLFDNFNSVSSGQGTSDATIVGATSLASTLDELTRQAGQLIAGVGEGGRLSSHGSSGSELYSVDVSAQSDSRLNTTPATETVGQATSGNGGTSALSVASTFFESGLGIVPLVTGLLGLFGSGSSTPPPLERYIMPDSLHFTGGDTTGGFSNADYDQFGMPRLYGGMTSAMTTPVSSSSTASSANGTAGGASPQINLTVHAMDSQSFLDHSSEIAQAVRQAMLSLSSVNDVVNDL